MPKANVQSPELRQVRRHNPLSEEYAPTSPLKQKTGKRRKLKHDEDEDDKFVDSKASRRILKIGQDLINEEEAIQRQARPNPAFELDSRFGEANVDDGDIARFDNDDDAWGSDEDEIEEVEIDPQDLKTFNMFNPTVGDKLPNLDSLLNSGVNANLEEEPQGTNLADLILEKIAAYEAANGNAPAQPHDRAHSPSDAPELPPKVVEVYTTTGHLLSRHRSGPLPKPFKILPSLPTDQIPQLIMLTNPHEWTPAAVFQATRLFISSAPQIAQQFLNAIVLPRIRADIHETRKLNVHLYAALKKALYKPASFFKGFLFPLLEGHDGACTLREAQIVSSVISRVSVPMLHSAAALLRLCDIAASQFSTRDPGSGGPANVFIKTLLEKKYALPYKVVDALVFHFLRFRSLDAVGFAEEEDQQMEGASMTQAKRNPQGLGKQLPLLWHQCLLVFAQRYRNDITEDQREALLDLILLRGHKAIGHEVRRELLEGRGRGIPEPEAVVEDGGDDTMMVEGS